MKREEITQVPNGYIIPQNLYDKICMELADTSAKLTFIKTSLLLMQEVQPIGDNTPTTYGLDSIIEDIIAVCDNTHNKPVS